MGGWKLESRSPSKLAAAYDDDDDDDDDNGGPHKAGSAKQRLTKPTKPVLGSVRRVQIDGGLH